MTMLESSPRQSSANRWSDDAKDRIRDLWIDGKSAAEISRIIRQKSRSAVLGQLHRLKKADAIPNERASVPLHGRRIPQPPSQEPSIADVNGLHYIPDDAPPIELPVEVPIVISTGPIPFLALTNHTCKFPEPGPKPYVFCGAKPRENAPYCEKHCRIAYQPFVPVPKEKRNKWTGGY